MQISPVSGPGSSYLTAITANWAQAREKRASSSSAMFLCWVSRAMMSWPRPARTTGMFLQQLGEAPVSERPP